MTQGTQKKGDGKQQSKLDAPHLIHPQEESKATLFMPWLFAAQPKRKREKRRRKRLRKKGICVFSRIRGGGMTGTKAQRQRNTMEQKRSLKEFPNPRQFRSTANPNKAPHARSRNRKAKRERSQPNHKLDLPGATEQHPCGSQEGRGSGGFPCDPDEAERSGRGSGRLVSRQAATATALAWLVAQRERERGGWRLYHSLDDNLMPITIPLGWAPPSVAACLPCAIRPYCLGRCDREVGRPSLTHVWTPKRARASNPERGGEGGGRHNSARHDLPSGACM